MLDALLSRVGRGRRPDDARHVAGEHDAALPRAPRDGEVRLGVELRVDLDEVDAERDERVDAGARLRPRLRARRCGMGTSPPSRYGPDAMMRGPTSCPRAISERHVLSVSQSPAMSRTPVTPFAT